ncbi:O-antigen/teichoic acid export membrane protein [Halanaerobium saccharolyticum]|uniref:O-antigen/teichoic acid export membrane protein n=1 Tax=Halanaerobium saccharolyticum TaxID=43595 RepID=A0A4R6M156_9FIRM|nr:oligosaccharide flippase family protein [Halanaerobium saccharolyticum]TDO94080.1 O-antigen/teichoic acid export membrane protein [Halanaerobium saccharolyticum]
MLNQIKTLRNKIINIPRQAKATIIFILASLITRGLSIISTPIFTRIMSTFEIGEVNIFNSWNNLIYLIVGLSLSSGSFNIAMKEFDDRDGYISSILGLSSISAILFIIIYFLFEDTFLNFIDISNFLVYIILLNVLLKPSMNFWMMRQRYEYKYKKMSIMTIISSILSVGLGVFCVIYASKNTNLSLANVRVLSMNIIPLIISIYLFITLIIRGKEIINIKYWKFALKLSIPLIFHSISKQILDVSDRIMIQHFDGLDKVGIYSIIYTLSSVSLLVWSAINRSIIPYLFDVLSEKIKKNKLKKIVNTLISFYAITCFLLILFAPELISILATDVYLDAIYLVPPIATGIFFTALYNIYANILLFYKKTKMIMFTSISAALINVILNFLFIPKFGYITAAYTTLFTFVILSIMNYYLSKIIHNGEKIYDDNFLFGISIVLISVSMPVILLYDYNVLRYIIIFITLLLIIIKRNDLLNIIKELISDNYDETL